MIVYISSMKCHKATMPLCWGLASRDEKERERERELEFQEETRKHDCVCSDSLQDR